MAAGEKGKIWAWPIAAAVLAAWPVWRSLFPETPDLALPGFSGELACGVASLVLAGAWIKTFHARMIGYGLPVAGILAGVALAVVAGARNDALASDLAALGIVWLVASMLFAGTVQLDAQAKLARQLDTPVAPVSLVQRGHQRIAFWLFAFAFAATAVSTPPSWSYLYAALAVASPGAILAWAALCDCARGVLSRRKAYVVDLFALPAVATHKQVIFGTADMLIADRLKVATIVPAGDVKPGDIVSWSAALLSEDATEQARAVHEFGVAHRVRVPSAKLLGAPAPALGRGRLPDQRIVEIGIATGSDDELAPFAETIIRAHELHRSILALREVEPAPRLLGLVVFARVARPGAVETVRALRKAGFSVEFSGAPPGPQEQEAMTGLALGAPVDMSGRTAIKVIRPDQAAIDSTPLTVHFGGRVRSKGQEIEILVARDDPRTLVDLIQFARDFRRRIPITLAIASLPGAALMAVALGVLPGSPLIVTIVAVAGILLAAAAPQVLRLSGAVANEVDEE